MFVFKLCIFQNKRVSINKDELKSTSKAIETVHNLCCNENKGASELVAELSTLYQCIRWAEKPVLTSHCWKESTIYDECYREVPLWAALWQHPYFRTSEIWSESSFQNYTFDFLKSFLHEDVNSGWHWQIAPLTLHSMFGPASGKGWQIVLSS